MCRCGDDTPAQLAVLSQIPQGTMEEELAHPGGTEGAAEEVDSVEGGLQPDAAYGVEGGKYELERVDGEGLPHTSKRQKLTERREPSWYAFTMPIDGVAKKRRCCQPGCQAVVHHGCVQKNVNN